MPSSLNDYLAHTTDRRIRQLILQMTRGLQPAFASATIDPLAQFADDSVAGGSSGGVGDSGGGDIVAATSGYDYSQASPSETSYPTIDERLDNLDSYVALPLLAHTHDGAGTKKIPASSVTVPPSITGESADISLADYFANRGGSKASVVAACAVQTDVPIISLPVPPYGQTPRSESSTYRGSVVFPTDSWGTLMGATASLMNLRNADGTPFAMDGFRWRERIMLPVFNPVSGQPTALDFTLCFRWSHINDPNAGAAVPLRLLADVSVVAFGY